MNLKKAKKWSWSSFFLGLLVAGLVLFIVREAKKEVVAWVSVPSKGRHPASIQKTLDFSGMQGEALNQAAKARILNGLNIARDQETNSIQLGNFVMLNNRQQKDFLCGVYNHVTLSFEAEGVAVNGEKPTLSVDSPCGVDENISNLAPIRIPFQQIKAISPRNHEFLLQQDSGALHILSGNNPDSWPRKWSLTDIKMTNENDPSQILHIAPEEIRSHTNKPVLMNW